MRPDWASFFRNESLIVSNFHRPGKLLWLPAARAEAPAIAGATQAAPTDEVRDQPNYDGNNGEDDRRASDADPGVDRVHEMVPDSCASGQVNQDAKLMAQRLDEKYIGLQASRVNRDKVLCFGEELEGLEGCHLLFGHLLRPWVRELPNILVNYLTSFAYIVVGGPVSAGNNTPIRGEQEDKAAFWCLRCGHFTHACEIESYI